MPSKARHWQDSDFVVTRTGGGYPGSEDHRYGYCRVCFGDMQQFGLDKRIGHYNSHGTAKALGLWGKQPAAQPRARRSTGPDLNKLWDFEDRTLGFS